jgi:hypothetical protein
VLNAEIAARELGSLSNADALALVLLYQQHDRGKFERAARRWVRRVQIDHSLRHQEVELLRGALNALGTRFSRVALDALVETCRGTTTTAAGRSRRSLGSSVIAGWRAVRHVVSTSRNAQCRRSRGG